MTASTKNAALLSLFLPCGLSAAFLSLAIAGLHNLVPANVRGTASAVLSLVVNVAGLGIGPVLIGLLSDHFAPQAGPDALRLACLWIVPTVGIWGARHCLLASRASDSQR
jgi:MFS family permease